MSEYHPASKAEVEVVNTKDTEYIAFIQSRIENIVDKLPLRYKKSLYQQNKKLIQNAAIVLYFSNGLITRKQTLSESYASIKPSKSRNFIHMIYLLMTNSKFYEKAQQLYPHLIRRLKTLINIIFYLFDFKVFQRSSPFNYLTTYPSLNDPFKTIGKLMLMKFGVSELYNGCIKQRLFPKQSSTQDSGITYENHECLLCSNEKINNPAVSDCGHIFCYDCYIKWTSKSLNCPLCRNPTHPREIVLLRN
ncbi:hypothetical protein AWRI3578_g3180 [Hanseniaspora opuntiae]|uniref:RING-type E3 ubiquitin transferase n=1 Tax=Hanseniaspora opuntiae TaxID=211096 RepID=A0A1E5R8V9_9ASCO|nr:hypothetical protein AWRI3578_g3180 [Hanseniaspora opuntiae]